MIKNNRLYSFQKMLLFFLCLDFTQIFYDTIRYMLYSFALIVFLFSFCFLYFSFYRQIEESEAERLKWKQKYEQQKYVAESRR